MLELDLFFDSYIKANKLELLSDEYLTKYTELLELEDSQLLISLQGKLALEDAKIQHLIDEIRSCKVRE